jgi:hypothetical protein
VFSDGYFRLLSSSSKFNRKDLQQFFNEKITSKIKLEYTQIRDKFKEESEGKDKKDYSRDGELPIVIELTDEKNVTKKLTKVVTKEE